MAKLSTVQDNFDDNSISAVWSTGFGGGGSVAETGQEILLSVQASTTGSYAELYTAEFYDAKDESNYVNLVGTAGTKCDTYFMYVNSSYDRFGFIWDAGEICSYINIGSNDEYRQYATVSAGESTYLRIRHSGSTVYWDYSTNGGMGWSTLDSATEPFSLQTIRSALGVYEWGSSSSPGAGRFDNFNYTTESSVSISNTEQITINENISIYMGTAMPVYVPGIDVIAIGETTSATVTTIPVEIGMNVFSTSDNLWYAPDDVFDAHVQSCLDAGITKIRVEVGSYGYAEPLQHSKEAVVRAKNAGAYVFWGVSGDSITASNWPDQRIAILDAAAWAQANGVDEFAIGNEEEYKVDGTTITVAQVQANLKSVATEVQSIFTRGPVSYNTSKDFLYDWISLGKGNIDTFGLNLYLGGQWGYDDTWMDAIDDAYAEWGSEAFLSEFGPSYTNLADYSTDETTQADGVQEMMDYCSYVGLGPAYYFCYYDDARPFGPAGFGALKTDDTYRELWDTLTRFVLVVQPTAFDTIHMVETIAIVVLSSRTAKPIELIGISDTVSIVAAEPFVTTLSLSVFDRVVLAETILTYNSILSINTYTTIYVYEYEFPYIKFIPRESLKTRRKTLYSGNIRKEYGGGAVQTISQIVSRGGTI